MELAKLVASWSKDESTKVGAVLVDERKVVLGLGYNGFPRGINDEVEERKQRPTKYLYTIHAEENAILNSNNSNLINSTIYCTFFPCPNCMGKLINVGVKKVVSYKKGMDNERWKEKFEISTEMCRESQIITKLY